MKTEVLEKSTVAMTPYKAFVDLRQQCIKDRERQLNTDGTADHYRKLFNKTVTAAAERGDERATFRFAKEHQEPLTLSCLMRLLEGDVKAAGYTLRESSVLGEMHVVLY